LTSEFDNVLCASVQCAAITCLSVAIGSVFDTLMSNLLLDLEPSLSDVFRFFSCWYVLTFLGRAFILLSFPIIL